MVKVLVDPLHDIPPFEKTGVTTIWAIIGAVLILVVVNAKMFPVPLAASPMPGVLFIHVYVVVPPVLLVPKGTAVIGEPLQTTWLEG
jgi:hypothetical protein